MGDITAVTLPPGFKFNPTDEELVLHFLCRKASLLPCYPDIIPDLDLYRLDPWQLDGKALSSGKQWYFFRRQTMENQVTESGVWKQLDVEEPIRVSDTNKTVGTKKYLVFCMGQSPATVETNWIVQEYHLCTNCTSRVNGTTCKRNKKSGSDLETVGPNDNCACGGSRISTNGFFVERIRGKEAILVEVLATKKTNMKTVEPSFPV